MSIPTSATKVVLKNAPTKEVNYEFGQPSSTFDVATEKLASRTPGWPDFGKNLVSLQ